ncbi:MAG: sodium:calcium antiporter, partial [Spirochaetaceae bacterium]
KLTPIARFFGVKELVITILGVSVLSSLPELTVSLAAGLAGESEISIANVVGSNFVTLTFVTAFCALIAPMVIQRETRDRESAWMILSSTAILILALDGELGRLDGVVLILLYIPYIATVVRDASRDSKNQPAGEKDQKAAGKGIIWHFVFIFLAIAGIIAGARIALAGGVKMGKDLGISDVVLGILIFAFGTSLPEFAIALSATFRKKAEISISEIYASNIFTAMAVLGFVCLVTPMPVSPAIMKFDLPFILLAGSVVQIFVTTGSKLVRLEAIVIMAIYIYFILGHFIPELPISAFVK